MGTTSVSGRWLALYYPLLQGEARINVVTFFSKPAERTRLYRFLVVGAIGFVVDFGTFYILNDLLGIQAVVAQIFSFTAAILSNFAWNRIWTYSDSRSKRTSLQLIQFASISVIGLIIRTPIFVLVNHFLLVFFTKFTQISNPVDLADYLALATAVGVVMFWNFFVNRFWTYNDVK